MTQTFRNISDKQSILFEGPFYCAQVIDINTTNSLDQQSLKHIFDIQCSVYGMAANQ